MFGESIMLATPDFCWIVWLVLAVKFSLGPPVASKPNFTWVVLLNFLTPFKSFWGISGIIYPNNLKVNVKKGKFKVSELESSTVFIHCK